MHKVPLAVNSNYPALPKCFSSESSTSLANNIPSKITQERRKGSATGTELSHDKTQRLG